MACLRQINNGKAPEAEGKITFRFRMGTGIVGPAMYQFRCHAGRDALTVLRGPPPPWVQKACDSAHTRYPFTWP
jgi:hypothetical protein